MEGKSKLKVENVYLGPISRLHGYSMHQVGESSTPSTAWLWYKSYRVDAVRNPVYYSPEAEGCVLFCRQGQLLLRYVHKK